MKAFITCIFINSYFGHSLTFPKNKWVRSTRYEFFYPKTSSSFIKKKRIELKINQIVLNVEALFVVYQDKAAHVRKDSCVMSAEIIWTVGSQ